MLESAYENGPRVIYACAEAGDATFVRVCEKCGRFVVADDTVLINDVRGLHPKVNATCSKCGRTRMLFEGFM